MSVKKNIIATMLLSLGLALPAGSVAVADDQKIDRLHQCRIEIIHGWENADVQWLGECTENVAEGLGVLKFYRDGVLLQSYFGQVDHGVPTIGIIDTGSGLKLNAPANNPTDNPEVERDGYFIALKVASLAAQRTSERLKEEGNMKSSKFYSHVADELWQELQ